MSRSTPPRLRREMGRLAEDLAADFLREKGYEVVDRNFTVRRGEVDLVVASDSVLAFVEVRSRADERWGTPEETIGPVKVRRVVHAARHWLARNGDMGKDLRFDVVAIDGSPDSPREIRHLPGAFEAGW